MDDKKIYDLVENIYANHPSDNTEKLAFGSMSSFFIFQNIFYVFKIIKITRAKSILNNNNIIIIVKIFVYYNDFITFFIISFHIVNILKYI